MKMESTSTSSSADSSADYRFDTSIFNGFRLLFNFAVVYGHVIYFTPIILDAPDLPFLLTGQSYPLATALSLPVFIMMIYAVDVFLFISGYLFGRSFCSFRKPNNNSALLPYYTWRHGISHIINRLLRLFPVLAIACMIGALRGLKPCMNRNVIYELLHIGNCNPNYGYSAPLSFTCMVVGWSLTTDVQAHAFMAFVLIFLKSNRRAAKIMCFAVVFQILCRANFLIQLGRPPLAMTVKNMASSLDDLTDFASVLNLPMGNMTFDADNVEYTLRGVIDTKLYASPYMRTAPAFIGFLTWYAVQQRTSYVRFIENNLLVSLLTVFFITATVFLSFFAIPALNGSPAWLCILYESVHRVVFTCAISGFVIILGSPITAAKSRVVCIVRKLYSNGIVNRIADLSYAIYLLHIYLLWISTVVPPRITREQFEMWRFVPSGVQVYLTAVVVSVPVHQFEKRFHLIRKRLTSQGIKPRSEKSITKEM